MAPAARPPNEPGSAWLTVPNLLSLGRLALTPVLAWLILSDRRVLATLLLAAMAFTDWLDGQIARATGTVTELGTTLDPISDRVLIMTTLITMMIAGILNVVLGTLVLLRDAVLSAVFLVLSRRGFGRPKVRRVGKAATFALLTALPGLLLGGILGAIGLGLFVFGGLLYYVAGYRYARDVQAWLEEHRAPFA